MNAACDEAAGIASSRVPVHELRRAVRPIRAVLRWAVLLLILWWVGRYVYTRLTVKPPLRPEQVGALIAEARTPEEQASMAEIDALLEQLAADIPFEVPDPPPGKIWDWRCLASKWRQESPEPVSASEVSWHLQRLDFTDALRGPWEFVGRPYLRQALAALGDAKMQGAIEHLVALRGTPWRPPALEYATASGSKSMGRARRAAEMLLADARAKGTVAADAPSALARIQTVLWLSESFPVNSLIEFLNARLLSEAASTELAFLAQEISFNEAVRLDALAALVTLRSHHSQWNRAMDAEIAWNQGWIDCCFTDVGHGEGWLVLTAQDALAEHMPLSHSYRAYSQAWDLASFCYNGRRAVEDKLQSYSSMLQSLGSMSLAEAEAEFTAFVRDTPRLFNVCDGPLIGDLIFDAPRPLKHSLTAETAYRAAHLTLALTAYQVDHGRYPESLNELVPQHLAAVPLDPFGDGPFRYTRSSGGFVLYSIGPNGIDDGGKRAEREEGDLVYSLPRPVPEREPVAVLAPQKAAPDANQGTGS